MSQPQASLEIAGKEVDGTNQDPPDAFDLQNRDPLELNQHLKISFEETFAEPHLSVFSFDFVWTYTYIIFRATKLWCYRILSLLCFLPASVYWGITFACVSFNQIWCCVPWFRCFQITVAYFGKYWAACIHIFYEPLILAVSKIFSNIVITIRKE